MGRLNRQRIGTADLRGNEHEGNQGAAHVLGRHRVLFPEVCSARCGVVVIGFEATPTLTIGGLIGMTAVSPEPPPSISPKNSLT